MNNLASFYRSLGRYEEAEPLLIDCLERRKQILGEDHLDTIDTLNNIAVLYESQGRYEEAEPLAAKLIELTPKDSDKNQESKDLLDRIRKAISEEEVEIQKSEKE